MSDKEMIRIELADDMPFESWSTYMWCELITRGLTKTHFITKDNEGKSWIKPKQR
jgi:hypothetical protein